jgi:peptide/nickel transport system substrate-binding protein
MLILLRNLFCLLWLLAPAHAATLRWASQNDHASADPHGQNQLINNSLNGQVYEYLVLRGKTLEILPSLAVGWRQASPTVWIFDLRRGVKWQDGSDFTADDVVFSVKRAQGDTSTFRVYGRAAGAARKIDDHTVEFVTPAPNPVMLETLQNIFIVSKAWCEKHNALRAQDFNAKEETYASRHAMGTGPYTLVSRDPDVKSVFRKNPAWWGIKEGLFEGNVDEIVYTPIPSEGTRMAALVSGELDFIIDPPIQDVDRLKQDKRIRVYEGPENLVFFLGMDQARDELLYSDVKGRNPLKDRRVRQAIYQAIDADAINRVVMRGQAAATAIILPNPDAAGVPKDLVRRYPYDVAAAKKLLGEAGYPAGFGITLDCQNVREKLCVALASMLARAGVSAKVNALQNTQFFAKGSRQDTSLYLLGWGGAATDAMFTLQPVLHSRDKGDGDYNWGNYKDAAFDALIDQAKVEMDAGKRQSLVNAAMKMHHDNVYHIPLHRRMAPWASRANVEVVHRANLWLEARWVKIGDRPLFPGR